MLAPKHHRGNSARSVADRLPETPERRAPPNAPVSLALVSQSAWPDLFHSATDTFAKMDKLPSFVALTPSGWQNQRTL